MLIKILIGLAVLLLILVVVIATRPGEFRYSRSRTMKVTPAAAFNQVNDFRKWNDWSPWAKLDPNCKNTFPGTTVGKGAIFDWEGNNEVGAGRMTLVESVPNERIAIELAFRKPFAATNAVEFTFKPEGENTVVTWTMSGKSNFVCKAMGLFMDCEKMCGDAFSQGLEAMEKNAKGDIAK